MAVVAIDVGGTAIKMGLVEKRTILKEKSVPVSSTDRFKHLLPSIQHEMDRILDASPLTVNDVEAISMGFPGIVDSKQMQVLSTNKKYDDVLSLDLKSWAMDYLGVPLFMENDARMALLGEWQYGIGKGVENIVMMTLGTGVGSAVLIEGCLLTGKHFQAGCLGGHFVVNFNGTACTCGNRGCVEAEASTWHLEEMLKSNPAFSSSKISGEKLDFKNLFRLAAEGEPLSVSVKDVCLEIWANGVINLIHAYDPELVIMDGGVLNSSEMIIPFIRKKVQDQAWTAWGTVQIQQSKIPNQSALLGAYYLARKNLNANEAEI